MAGLSLRRKMLTRNVVVIAAWIQIATLLRCFLVLLSGYLLEHADDECPATEGISCTCEGTSDTCLKRKRRRNSATLKLSEVMKIMTSNMTEALAMLSKSVHSDLLQQKLLELPNALRSIDGLTASERRMAMRRFGKHSNEVLLFFGTDPEERLDMVRDLLSSD